MLKPALVPVLLLLPLCCVAAADQFPSYPCFQAPVSPQIDGALDADPAWTGTVPATGFSKLGDSYTIVKQTTFRACWDADALYFGVLCEEPDVALMRFSTSDGGDAWLDDGIELFLQPGEETYQLIVTGRGARSCGQGAPDFTKVQAAVGKGPDWYALEIRVPHTILSARPEVGRRWHFDVCRNIFTKQSGGDQFTSWAPLTRQFFEPEHYTDLLFQGKAPDADALALLTRQVNDHYRQYLLDSMRGVLALAPEYADVLNEAVKDAVFGRRARDLRRGWRRLERLVRQAADAPVNDLRTASLGAAGLAQDSYELKYRYLIHKLLEES